MEKGKRGTRCVLNAQVGPGTSTAWGLLEDPGALESQRTVTSGAWKKKVSFHLRCLEGQRKELKHFLWLHVLENFRWQMTVPVKNLCSYWAKQRDREPRKWAAAHADWFWQRQRRQLPVLWGKDGSWATEAAWEKDTVPWNRRDPRSAMGSRIKCNQTELEWARGTLHHWHTAAHKPSPLPPWWCTRRWPQRTEFRESRDRGIY